MFRGLSSIRFQLAAAAALILLLAIVATLQYRWIGQVSEAERDRLRANAKRGADAVALDFERELARVTRDFSIFETSSDAAPRKETELGALVVDADNRWTADSKFPSLVSAVFLVRRASGREITADRVDPASGAREAAPASDAVDAARAAIERDSSPEDAGGRRSDQRRGGPPRRPPWQILSTVPAVLIADYGSVEARDSRDSRVRRWVLVRLDRAAIQRSFLPQLIRRHFGEGGEYDVAVVRRADPTDVLFRTRQEFSPDTRAPDAEVALFAGPAVPGFGHGDRRSPSPDEFRRDTPDRALGPWPPSALSGGWRLLVSHRSGSLQAAVDATRRRNLAVSAGILILLAAAVITLMISADRARSLARRQLEFVAGITHELRTPLAAIRSAGQNLADGVVEDPSRVREYGDLLVREGRRLSELIEQALALADITVRRHAPARATDVGEVVEEAIAACRAAAPLGTRIESELARDLPKVMADRSALRTLFENLITNAVKHGGRGGAVVVRARAAPRSVDVSVTDRGPGIAARDLPHIFEPFYRGREASGRTPGSGLGLSLVRRIAQAHGGQVRVESAPGEGATFGVTLPAAPESSPAVQPVVEIAP